MDFLRDLAHALVPHRGNSYRPRLLSKQALALYLSLVLVAEAYFVSGLYGANPSQPFLAAASASLASPSLADIAIGGVAALLALLLAVNFFFHIRIQSRDTLAVGLAIVGIALLLLALNAWYAAHYGIT